MPDPRLGAGYPRAAEMLKAALAAGWSVTCLPLIASRVELARMRRRHPGVRFVPNRRPDALAAFLREQVGAFDAVLVSRPAVMEAFSAACAQVPRFLAGTFCIYDAEAIFTLREAGRRALFAQPPSETERAIAFDRETAIAGAAQAILAVTGADAALFRSATAASVHVVSHSVPVEPSPASFAARRDLLFVGRLSGPRDHSPNVDSLVWFVEEVMPLLDVKIGPDYRLVAVGRVASPEIRALASPRVVLAGVVDDLAALYDRCRLFVAPTRFAAGLPIKVVEAAAAGLPCAATQLVADLSGFASGVEIAAGADAAGLAAACALLYTDAQSWQDAREAGLARVARDFSRAQLERSMAAVLAQALAARAA